MPNLETSSGETSLYLNRIIREAIMHPTKKGHFKDINMPKITKHDIAIISMDLATKNAWRIPIATTTECRPLSKWNSKS